MGVWLEELVVFESVSQPAIIAELFEWVLCMCVNGGELVSWGKCYYTGVRVRGGCRRDASAYAYTHLHKSPYN